MAAARRLPRPRPTRRRGSGSGRAARAPRRRSEMPPCRSRTSMIWTTGCKNAVCVLLCVRVRASSRALCLKAQLSRLAQERRYATLTAARQAAPQLPGYQQTAITAFPLTPRALVANRCTQSIALTARKRPRSTPRAPTRRQQAESICADTLPRFKRRRRAASTTARRHLPFPRPQQRAHGKTGQWAPTSGQRD